MSGFSIIRFSLIKPPALLVVQTADKPCQNWRGLLFKTNGGKICGKMRMRSYDGHQMA